ncbi:MAG: helicase, superfamily [Bacillota bacterium]|jgi:DNA helicase-2/ATP-dependent DNA helicase PcrA|nr:helicase, superfamily [Bacillota bacterium]
MFNAQEMDERSYLDAVLEKLQTAFENIEQKIAHYSEEIVEAKRYIYENQAQFDSAEKASNRMAVYQNIAIGEKAVLQREKLQKLIQSPYFGRIDFAVSKNSNEDVFYIGIYGFSDSESYDNIIFDWRAPVSSIFYDFEIGPAYYNAPDGRIEGALNLKRQYRIRQSQMDYMIESSLNIGDDILQKELSQNSDEKMKNIVTTIQREQNKIIRNEVAKVLIIQGVAGSGKTSIALHRVAFLLYRYKQTLTSNNILIISPNKVFGSYISNVLPELGEENILESGFDDIAADIMDKKYRYQTFSEQIESLLETENTEAVARIKFKATNHFVEQLQSYLEYADDHYFDPIDLKLGAFSISKADLLLRYRSLKRLPIKQRLRKIADDMIGKYRMVYEEKPDSKTVNQLRANILKMFRYPKAISLYQNFYRYINKEHLFQFHQRNTFEFCDVYPFIYVKMHFDGVEQDYKSIQHLLVDEMQDYTPIQYAVLAKLFSCKMTILGDSNQSVNPYSSSSAEKIRPFFKDCDCAELCKSYRSTIEIAHFAQRIQENKNLIPIERHGEIPCVSACHSQAHQFHKILDLIQIFKQSGYRSLGIICKSQKQANELYEDIKTVHEDILLLTFTSSEFKEGIIISSAHMSKGLEYDQVIVPNVSNDCYTTEMDRSLLYVACTRAMHKLELTYYGTKTEFILP